MSESRRFLFKLLSLLLQYPDTGLKSAFSDLEELSSKLSERSAELICRRFLPYLQTTPLLRAQEYYTQTFDLSPESCLYLTWHRWGEGEERGRRARAGPGASSPDLSASRLRVCLERFARLPAVGFGVCFGLSRRQRVRIVEQV